MNFFNWIEPGYNFTTQDQSFEAVLKYTKEFETELTKEKMSAHISELLALELHPILRLAPLELKNLCIQAGAKSRRRIQQQSFLISTQLKCLQVMCLISNDLACIQTLRNLNCVCVPSRINYHLHLHPIDTVNIERNFYRLLKEQGITSEKVKPEFSKDR